MRTRLNKRAAPLRGRIGLAPTAEDLARHYLLGPLARD